MFDWHGFLQVAEDLAARNDEAGLRSAISRAYYAAFCSARNHLRDQEGASIPKTGAAHTDVWKRFEENADVDRFRIATLGRRLRRSRNKADYEDEVHRLVDLAEDALTDARQVLELLRQL